MGKTNLVPPLGLLMLAAVTPQNINIKLIDERLERINFDEPVELVGITVVTKSSNHAYRIADEFRKRGVTVVLGGIHPTVLPDEAKQHSDAVVLGEGEKAWVQLLDDFQHGQIKPIYYGGYANEIKDLPWPRRNIVSHPDLYLTTKTIMATRGCENSCTFCSNGAALGKKYRERDIEDVLEEIKSIPGKFVHFLDDNIGWDIEFTKSLLKSLIPLKIKWIGSTTLPAIEDDDLVKLMVDSGCIALDLGFESTSEEVIHEIHKHRTNDVKYYKKLITKLHRSNIPIYGNFILGFDQDDSSVFDKVIEFVNETKIDSPMVNVLIPYPGSVLYRKYERDGRLLHKEWEYYDDGPGCVVYSPMKMSPFELMDGFVKVISTVNSPLGYLKRIMQTRKMNLYGIGLGFLFNLQKRSHVLNGRDKAKLSLEI
jgi:radical SAM superfamily enzyme YgiQ (UPF0313 family)